MLERDRWHAELTPTFSARAETQSNGTVRLELTLEGPKGIEYLNRVTVSIRDFRTPEALGLEGAASAEQIADVVWAAYRFTPGVDRAGRNGRTVAYETILRPSGELVAQLEPTTSPSWSRELGKSWWSGRVGGDLLRLSVECVHEDSQWIVPMDIVPQHPPYVYS